MKKAYIIHGWGDSPRVPLHIWMKSELESKGFQVIVPEMPNPDEPKVKEWTEKLVEVVKSPNQDIFFIGHSVGCQTILRFLQTLPEETEIGGVVLIAPWMHLDEATIEEEGPEVVEIARPWMETPLNWEKIKAHTSNFFCIFSDDDPFVPLSDEQLFQDKLGARTLMLHEKGHFTGEGGVSELPESVEKIVEFAK